MASSNQKPPAKLSTPQGQAAEKIITKDYVDVPLTLESAEKITTQYGLAFVAQGHPVSGKDSKKSVSILIGASVLVKTLQQHIDAYGDQAFPIMVTCVKPKGARYFVFE